MLNERVSDCAHCPLRAREQCEFQPRKVPAGAQLWSQGEAGLRLAFVKDGLFGLSASNADGRQCVASVRGPRSMLGLESLDAVPARTTAVALVDSTVCSPRVTPSDAGVLLRFTLDELSQLSRDADLRSGSAANRVARFLLRHATLVASGRRAPFSKRHVAQLLGLRAETLSRRLRELIDAGFIDEQLVILNRAGLEGVADDA